MDLPIPSAFSNDPSSEEWIKVSRSLRNQWPDASLNRVGRKPAELMQTSNLSIEFHRFFEWLTSDFLMMMIQGIDRAPHGKPKETQRNWNINKLSAWACSLPPVSGNCGWFRIGLTALKPLRRTPHASPFNSFWVPVSLSLSLFSVQKR